MFRKLLIALAGLLLALVLTVVAALLFVDVNRFKPQVERYALQQWQRSLKLDGDLKLSLWPRIGIALPKATLSEPGKPDSIAARLGAATFDVALRPLLSGRLEADTLRIEGLQATIERRADGSLSIDDVLGIESPEQAQPGSGDAASQAPRPPQTPAAGAAAPQAPGADASTARAADGTAPRATDATAAHAGTSPSPASPPPRDASSTPAHIRDFELAGIKLEGASLTFVDHMTSRTVRLNDVSLDAGKLAPVGRTPASLKLRFDSDQPKAAGSLEFKGTLVYDLNARAYGAQAVDATLSGSVEKAIIEQARLRIEQLDLAQAALTVSGLDLSGAGQLDGERFTTTVKAPRLTVDEKAAGGDTVHAAFKFEGARQVDANVQLQGLSGKASALAIQQLMLDATLKEGARTVKAALASPVQGDLDANAWELPALAGTVDISDPAVPGGKAAIALSGSAAARLNEEQVSASLKANAQDIALVAKGSVAGFKSPKVRFEVQADQLDVDRYFPAATQGKAAAAASLLDTLIPVAAAAPSNKPEDTPIDLSVLRELDLEGNVQVGRLVARNIKAQDLRFTAKAAGGRLVVAPLTAALYDGRLNGRATADAKGNALHFAGTIDRISINPLLRDATGRDLLEGRGKVSADLGGSGATVDALKRSLSGSFALDLRDGAIKGINIGQRLREARNLLQGGGATAQAEQVDTAQKTDFTEMTVGFKVNNGIASSNDLAIKSPLLRIGGEGRIDIPATTMDYVLRTTVVNTASGQGGKELEQLRGITVPVRLSGPLDTLAWRIEWGEIARELVQARVEQELKARAGDELKKRLGDDVQKALGGRGGDALGGALKGLFGR